MDEETEAEMEGEAFTSEQIIGKVRETCEAANQVRNCLCSHAAGELALLTFGLFGYQSNR